MASPPKRSRGGQPGNQNARKCGFYSRFSPEQMEQLADLLHSESIDPFSAIMRIKLKGVLEHEPLNQRAILEGCNLIAKYYASKFDLTGSNARVIKETLKNMLLTKYTLTEPGLQTLGIPSFSVNPQNESASF